MMMISHRVSKSYRHSAPTARVTILPNNQKGDGSLEAVWVETGEELQNRLVISNPMSIPVCEVPTQAEKRKHEGDTEDKVGL